MIVGSSPLTRGKLDVGDVQPPRGGLIPAHAGKTPRGSRGPAVRPAHPRSRGENVLEEIGGDVEKGSSPLTRGKPGRKSVLAVMMGLIPAHAGKTRPPVRTVRRVRGSSPLTRGKLR